MKKELLNLFESEVRIQKFANHEVSKALSIDFFFWKEAICTQFPLRLAVSKWKVLNWRESLVKTL